MAEYAELMLTGVPYITDNYEKVWDPAKDKTVKGVRHIKGRFKNKQGQWEDYTDTESFSDDARPRSRRYSDGRPSRSRARSPREDMIEQRRAMRVTDGGRARSTGREDRSYRRSRTARDYSDSEASLSPPPRRSKSKRRQSLGERAMAALGLGAAGGAAAGGRRRSYSSSRSRSRSRDRSRRRRRRSISSEDDRVRSSRGAIAPYRGVGDDRTPARYKPAAYTGGENGRDRDGGSTAMVRGGNTFVAQTRSKRSSSKSSSSSSDVCSSSEDERRTRKMRGKEWVTAGLAAVATIHAAHGVYSSMEARDKRAMEVMKGEMSVEEARKKKNKARLQDAAAIGIAALGIKGAYSEWQEVQESRHEMGELKRERAERHEKRLRKAEKHGYYKGHSGRNSSVPDYDRRRRERSV